jgi:hypothetical protein
VPVTEVVGGGELGLMQSGIGFSQAQRSKPRANRDRVSRVEPAAWHIFFLFLCARRPQLSGRKEEILRLGKRKFRDLSILPGA